MPYVTKWVSNPRFFSFRKVVVYHTYHSDNQDEGMLASWYTTAKDGCEHHVETFDVRDIYQALGDAWRERSHKEVIKVAIRLGWLTVDGLDIPDEVDDDRPCPDCGEDGGTKCGAVGCPC